MAILATVLVSIVGVLHVLFGVMEMFLWDSMGRRFGSSKEEVEIMRPAMKNQGLYNWFLAAGCFWGAYLGNTGPGLELRLFFMGCVVIAGIVGALTVSGRIFVIQSVPALAAIALVLLA